MNLLIAWILLTLPVITVLQALLRFLFVREEDDKNMVPTAVILSLLLWWGIYFLIK